MLNLCVLSALPAKSLETEQSFSCQFGRPDKRTNCKSFAETSWDAGDLKLSTGVGIERYGSPEVETQTNVPVRFTGESDLIKVTVGLDGTSDGSHPYLELEGKYKLNNDVRFNGVLVREVEKASADTIDRELEKTQLRLRYQQKLSPVLDSDVRGEMGWYDNGNRVGQLQGRVNYRATPTTQVAVSGLYRNAKFSDEGYWTPEEGVSQGRVEVRQGFKVGDVTGIVGLSGGVSLDKSTNFIGSVGVAAHYPITSELGIKASLGCSYGCTGFLSLQGNF